MKSFKESLRDCCEMVDIESIIKNSKSQTVKFKVSFQKEVVESAMIEDRVSQ